MAHQLNPSELNGDPDVMEVSGRAMERAGKKHLDMDMVREGRRLQAQAQAMREASFRKPH
jgi:hypothetical protein